MEELYLLTEVVGELIDNGYLLQAEFSECLEGLKKSKIDIAASEFKIDNVYQCYDEFDKEEVLIFAVSSKKNGLKAICFPLDIEEKKSFKFPFSIFNHLKMLFS